MANTFELIASSTVGSGGAATISFSSIPSTFTDLCVKFSARDNSSYIANNIALSFNGSTSSFSVRNLYGNGSSALSGTSSNQAGLAAAANATSNTFSNSEFYIPNYAGSTNKSYSADTVSENNATEAYDWFNAGLWSNTAAITSITITAGSSATFQNYSNFYLYGVKNA
jgi:hypothetical protein